MPTIYVLITEDFTSAKKAKITKKAKFIIPGTVVAAMLMSGIDASDWLRKEVAEIQKTDKQSLKLDPFEDLTESYNLEIGDVEEFEVNRRVFGLLNSLTPREIEVLKKRILEHKSITQTSNEMKIKPQAVVAFMASIRKRVDKYG